MHRPRGRVLSTRNHARRADLRRRAAILPLCDAPAVAVTSKDIARRLNISQSTVSRALRGDPRVSAETKARILEAARQMDYTPNLAARSLITRRTGTIGLIVSDITNPFYPELLGVLHNEFALAGYRTVLFNERTDAPLERHVADLVNGAAVDGLVYVSATLGMPLPGSGTGRIPVVLDDTLRRVGQFSHHSGYQWGLDLLASRARPSAIFAANDLIAFGALDAARRIGIRVPEDLSVVGFDDIDMAGWEAFNLTTVKQPLGTMGREAVGLLLERIAAAEDAAPPRRRTLPVE